MRLLEDAQSVVLQEVHNVLNPCFLLVWQVTSLPASVLRVFSRQEEGDHETQSVAIYSLEFCSGPFLIENSNSSVQIRDSLTMFLSPDRKGLGRGELLLTKNSLLDNVLQYTLKQSCLVNILTNKLNYFSIFRRKSI